MLTLLLLARTPSERSRQMYSHVFQPGKFAVKCAQPQLSVFSHVNTLKYTQSQAQPSLTESQTGGQEQRQGGVQPSGCSMTSRRP